MKEIKYLFLLLWLCSNAQAQNTLVAKLCFSNEDMRLQAIIEPILNDSIQIILHITNQTNDTIAIDGQIRPYFYNHDSTLDISGDFFGIRACYESYHKFQKLAPHQIFSLQLKIHTAFGVHLYQKVHLELMYVKNIADCIKKKWFIKSNFPEGSNDLLFPLNEQLSYDPLNGMDINYDPKTQKSSFLINCRICNQF